MRSRRLVLGVMVVVLAVGSILVACGGDEEPASGSFVRYGPGMMGYLGSEGGVPVEDMGAAREQAEAFAAGLGLSAGEVMQFEQNFYVELVDGEGAGATEVLVDPATGAVWLEYGPAMMWNTKYGMLAAGGGGPGMMMGGARATRGLMSGIPFGDPSWQAGPDVTDEISEEEAVELTDRWLKEQGLGVVPGEVTAFPGYYTLHVMDADNIIGMLSVNAVTGTVWYHWWHGAFLDLQEGQPHP